MVYKGIAYLVFTISILLIGYECYRIHKGLDKKKLNLSDLMGFIINAMWIGTMLGLSKKCVDYLELLSHGG